MIHHCVFLSFKPTCEAPERQRLLSGFLPIVDEIPGMLSFSAGPNADFEAKTEQYSDGFVAVFADREAMVAYETNSRHIELGRQLVENCVGGYDGILVFDIVSV